MNSEKKKQEIRAWHVFLIHFAAALLVFAWAIIAGRGFFSLAGDFNSQQLVFTMSANELIKAGEYYWDWSLDLGSGLPGSMSFYLLGNPSFLISLLFPASWFPYIAGWLYVLKYAVAGVSSFCWIARHVEEKRFALLGSFFYAFSGFSATSLLFYHFHDVVALFPLLLIAADDLMGKGKVGRLIPAVFLNGCVCYFFLPGELLFLAAYVLFRYVWADRKKAKEKLPQFLTEGFLGCALTAVLLLPAFLSVLQNPRVGNDYYGANALVFSGERYLFILKALLFPGEVMSAQSALIETNFASCGAYLPMVGAILVIAFWRSFPKHWLRRMLLFSLVTAAVPVFNAAYALFAGLYYRWYYMPVLMMALASAIMLDTRARERRRFAFPGPADQKIRSSAILWALITLLFLALMVAVPWTKDGESAIKEWPIFLMWSLFALIGTFLTLYLLYQKSDKTRIFSYAVVAFALLSTLATFAMYRGVSEESPGQLKDRFEASRELTRGEAGYRFANTENELTILAHRPGTGSFCSTVSGGIFKFYDALGLKRDVRTPKNRPQGIEELLSVRYRIETEESDHGALIQSLRVGEESYYVYENERALPIGFCFDSYMTMSEFLETAPALRAKTMLSALIVPDEAEAKVREVLTHAPGEVNAAVTTGQLLDLHREGLAKDIFFDSRSYCATINSKKESYAFFSIPDDGGWSVTVNGKEEEIIESCGMMAIRVYEGENRIAFAYRVPGSKAGIVISAFAFCASVLYVILFLRHKKRSRATATPKE